jgi:tRNA(Ile)-lysidine synthase
VSRFARSLLAEWKRLGLPLEKERVVVAVSGGADSTALLLGLEELSRAGLLALTLTVAHLDHGLRGEEARADALWVTELCARLGLEVEAGRVSAAERAASSRDNLEQAARHARYDFLSGVLAGRGARLLLTAHTMDDQAETVLMRLMRGSGPAGLGGMEAVRLLDQKTETRLVRPLLGWARRAETVEYCAARGVEARIDPMNEDERFVRVRVRRQLLPLMLSFNGRLVEALSRTAELLRESDAALRVAAEALLVEASAAGTSEGEAAAESSGASDCAALRVDVLREAPGGLRRRALRLWIERGRGSTRRLELVHLRGVEALLEGTRGGRTALLPGGGKVHRKRGWLYLDAKKVEKGVGPV